MGFLQAYWFSPKGYVGRVFAIVNIPCQPCLFLRQGNTFSKHSKLNHRSCLSEDTDLKLAEEPHNMKKEKLQLYIKGVDLNNKRRVHFKLKKNNQNYNVCSNNSDCFLKKRLTNFLKINISSRAAKFWTEIEW